MIERCLKKLFFLILVIIATATLFPPAEVAGDTGANLKLVCITFDDGWQNQYDNALPVLHQYGFKATFAIVTTWVDDEGGQCMDYNDLHELADQGMDIASHTRTHAHLPNVDAARLQNEVAVSKTELEDEGFTVRMLVYPFYEYTETVISATKNAGYLCARSGARNEPYDPADRTNPDSQYEIDAIQIDDQTLNEFKSIVDEATGRSVICLNYHSVSDEDDTFYAPNPRTPEVNFGEQMRYLSENGFTVALLPDLVEGSWITRSPASMTFSGTQGGSNPPSQDLNISNSGGGTLTWTASCNATWLATAPTSETAPSTVTVTTDTTGLSAGTYNGTITIDAANATNTPETVSVVLTVNAAPPVAPTLLSPADGTTVSGSSITFQWSPVSGATNYAVQVSTSPTFSPLFHYNYTYGKTYFTYTDFPNNGTTYYWRAKSYKASGWGDWSTYLSFINGSGSDTPLAPTLSSPANGANISGNSVTFQWNPASGATNYAVQVSTSPTFSPLFHYNYTYGKTYFTYTDFPHSGTTYYWRARSYNASGWGDWSAYRHFINSSGGITPPAPTLISPADGSTVSGSSVTFQWSSVSGATNYAVQVSTSPTFSTLFHYNYSNGRTSFTYNDFPHSGTTYYWRARAYNSAGWGDWSTARSFINEF